MRKIRIDAEVEEIANDYKLALDKHKTEIVDAIDNLLAKFDGKHTITKKTKTGNVPLTFAEVTERNRYIAKLKLDYDNGDLTLMLPDSFEVTYKNDYKPLIGVKELKRIISIDGDKGESLSKRLITAMGYGKYVRKEIFPALMRRLGIKACVYCNANYVVATENGGGYFELDHWKPESKYPFLCTSFYNLLPCCSHCNKRKSDDNDREYLKLYEEDPNAPLDVFEFQIPKGSLVRYFIEHDISNLKLMFKAEDASCEKLRNDANEKFGIEGIYNEHLDVVEEMMWRAQFYNNVIVGSMTWIFKKRRPMIDIPRFKLGTYAELDEVHKRPLTKMMQDVGKQLEII